MRERTKESLAEFLTAKYEHIARVVKTRHKVSLGNVKVRGVRKAKDKTLPKTKRKSAKQIKQEAKELDSLSFLGLDL
jgi:hypothetical protein